jgi:hypothetical protein
MYNPEDDDWIETIEKDEDEEEDWNFEPDEDD